ncbi:hypothetical protein BDV93DRAFT_610581 [Ceratobasidium sp. AG-I]|nr:hypothetical protein BDV93DRAFT_610581 [Ceratobasidium sp. AG-I]
MHLPPELWLRIAECLRQDQRSMSRLAQVNAQLFENLLPILYDDITISSPPLLDPFFDAIITSPRQLGQFARIMSLGERTRYNQMSWLRLNKQLALKLRTTLESMPNLRSLWLNITPDAFNICFEQLQAPFELEFCAVPCVDSNAFYQFLSSHSSITELEIFVPTYGRGPVVDFFAAHSEILPQLRKFTGPWRIEQIFRSRLRK